MSNKSFDHEPKFLFSKITENIYLGGSMCCKEHERYHGEMLREMGIDVDIDMRLEVEEIHPRGIDAHLRLPVPDTYAPTMMQAEIGVALIKRVVGEGKKIYVHCQVGHGRSPTLVIAYFILEKGMEVDEAIAFVKSRRKEVHPTDRQLEFLHSLKE